MADRKVTVDTGGSDDIFSGALVTWLHVPRGGYGFSVPIPVKVEKISRARVTIKVRTRAGREVLRHVTPEVLRWRNG